MKGLFFLCSLICISFNFQANADFIVVDKDIVGKVTWTLPAEKSIHVFVKEDQGEKYYGNLNKMFVSFPALPENEGQRDGVELKVSNNGKGVNTAIYATSCEGVESYCASGTNPFDLTMWMTVRLFKVPSIKSVVIVSSQKSQLVNNCRAIFSITDFDTKILTATKDECTKKVTGLDKNTMVVSEYSPTECDFKKAGPTITKSTNASSLGKYITVSDPFNLTAETAVWYYSLSALKERKFTREQIVNSLSPPEGLRMISPVVTPGDKDPIPPDARRVPTTNDEGGDNTNDGGNNTNDGGNNTNGGNNSDTPSPAAKKSSVDTYVKVAVGSIVALSPLFM